MKGYHDIAGDGGSAILAQVETQRESVARNLSGVRRLLAVGSGKGGVGKSTLTMQLARALRAQRHTVSILDADLGGPSQARLGALRDGAWIPGQAGAGVPAVPGGIGVVSMATLVPEPRAVEFESVASGSAHTWWTTREFTTVRQLLAGMEWGTLDYLLVDLPPGVERTAQYAELLGPAAAFVLVAIPSDLARGVVSRTIAALAKTPNPVLGYIENMAGYYCAGCQSVQPLFPEESQVRLTLPRLGSVPFDPELAARCDRGGSPSDSPELPSWQAFRHIAEEVHRRVAERAPVPEEER